MLTSSFIPSARRSTAPDVVADTRVELVLTDCRDAGAKLRKAAIHCSFRASVSLANLYPIPGPAKQERHKTMSPHRTHIRLMRLTDYVPAGNLLISSFVDHLDGVGVHEAQWCGRLDMLRSVL